MIKSDVTGIRGILFPFDGASYGVGGWICDRLSGEVLVEGGFEVVFGDVFGDSWGVGGSAGVDEVAGFVEDEEVGGDEGAVGAGGLLGLVAEVEPGEIVFFHSCDHVVEVVVGVGGRVVGVDHDELDALFGVFIDGSAGAFIGVVDEGAVVAGEGDDEGGFFEVVEGVGLAVGGGEGEGGGLVVDVEWHDWVPLCL